MNEETINGCIAHKDTRHLRLYYDYLDIYKNNEHKAKIVRILETWTDTKRAAWYKYALEQKEQGHTPQEPDFWITMSFQQFRHFMRETVGIDTIKGNLSELMKLKHIERRVNPENPYGPPQYKLNCAIIQKAINKLTPAPFIPEIPDLGEEKTTQDIPTPPGKDTPLPGVSIPPTQGGNIPLPQGGKPATSYITVTKITTQNNEEESIPPAIADVLACGASAPALSQIDLQEKMLEDETICSKCGNLTITPNDCSWCKASKQIDLQEKSDEIPVTYADCLALLREHNVAPKGDAVAIMVQARTLYALAHTDLEDEMSVPYARQETVDLQEKGQTDGSNSTYRSTDYAARRGDSSSSRHPREATVEQIPSISKPAQEVPPLATLSKMPEQAALMASVDPKARAKAAPKKAAEPEHKGPPIAPSEDMEWSTRKCLQWFDFWRGAPLIGKFKLMQASTCAKGLAENYSEQQVVNARTDMEADIYWMSHGGVDVCEVANNIHKYVRKRNAKPEPVPVARPSVLVSELQSAKNFLRMYKTALEARRKEGKGRDIVELETLVSQYEAKVAQLS